MRRRLRRLTDRDRTALDAVLVALVLAATVVNAILLPDREGPLVPALMLAVAIAASFHWRRRAPLVPVAVVSACSAASSLFLTPAPLLATVTAATILASYSVGAHAASVREARIGLAAIVVLIAGQCIAFTPTDIAFPVAIFGVLPWAGGRTIRDNTMLVRELAEKADLAEHARADEERRAVAAERARVARELHDVLAHNLSVMVIQASGARRTLADRPQAALDAAGLIARTGRETLAELRYLFGPVRHGEGEDLDGSPGLGHLDALAARARAAGLPVEVTVEGEPPERLPAGIDATGYRLVQEALTNSLKHGGASGATVHLRYERGDVAIEVLDEGPRSDAPGREGGGHGLIGMGERVALHGGSLHAGPSPEGGFAVRARLPLEQEVPA